MVQLLEFKGFLSFLILHEISYRPMAGDDLAKKIGSRKGVVLTPGTIYPALKQLREKKLVVYKQFGRKKMYSMTKKGQQELEKQYVLFSNYFFGLKNKIKRKNLS